MLRFFKKFNSPKFVINLYLTKLKILAVFLFQITFSSAIIRSSFIMKDQYTLIHNIINYFLISKNMKKSVSFSIILERKWVFYDLYKKRNTIKVTKELSLYYLSG